MTATAPSRCTPIEAPGDSARWRAVLARDRQADGLFVYAVQSTGIYCRPSCVSRRPRRDRVSFFASAAQAEREGFRACRRCRPNEAAATDPWIDRIREACVHLANGEGHLSLAKLSARLGGGSPYHLQRNFTRIVGVTPREFREACRLRTVKQRLRQGGQVTDAVVEAGYGSSSRFYERAAPRLGMSPTTYQQGGAGMSIRYTVVDSPLGRLLVAATARGVCAVAMAASDEVLTRGLAREYPAATISADAGGLAKWTARILGHLGGRQPRLDLPLDIQATSFQWQVWEALRGIPRGETRSYAELARAIGRPGASRAVGRACATNPVALAIPCHRVVPASGGVGGYRWGVARKKKLLLSEAAGLRSRRSQGPAQE